MGWFSFFKKSPMEAVKPIESWHCRLDDIEDEIKQIKEDLKIEVDLANRAFKELRERIESLEKEPEWKPRFGDKVRFKHSFFGEMNGIFLEAVFPDRWSLMFRDPSNDGKLKHYVADAKDVEKADE